MKCTRSSLTLIVSSVFTNYTSSILRNVFIQDYTQQTLVPIFRNRFPIVMIVDALLSDDPRLIATVHENGGVVSNPSVNQLLIGYLLCMNTYGDWYPSIQSQVKFVAYKYKEDGSQSNINSGYYTTMQFFDSFILS